MLFPSCLRPRPHSLSLLLAATLLAPVFVQAQPMAGDDLGRVEISGRPADTPRSDVRRTCPQVEVKLQEELAFPMYMEAATGLVRVDFRLSGDRVAEVRTSGGPRTMHRYIRRAMHRVGCQADDAPEQRYSFLIQMLAPDEVSGEEPRIALLMAR